MTKLKIPTNFQWNQNASNIQNTTRDSYFVKRKTKPDDSKNKNLDNSWYVGTLSRESSVTKTSTIRMKKPPTVPKPFRLSSSNWRKSTEKTESAYVEEMNKKLTTKKFQAKEIPKSHRVPFMVMHSTKDLTEPETFVLRTKQRSISKHRSNSNKPDQTWTQANDDKCSNNDKIIQQILNEETEIEEAEKEEVVEKPSNMFDFDIDELIKKQDEILAMGWTDSKN